MSPAIPVQYLTDDQGTKTAVVVPIQTWNDLLPIFRQYSDLKDSIRRGLNDVEMRERNDTEETIQSFLDEL